jgi:lipopolysaccharide biosynthesis regulator YciM
LQSGINKKIGLDLVTIEVKKEVDDLVLVVFELRKEVEETICAEIEIKEKVEDPTTFGIKQEVESELQDLRIVPEKADLSGIQKLVQEYTNEYS